MFIAAFLFITILLFIFSPIAVVFCFVVDIFVPPPLVWLSSGPKINFILLLIGGIKQEIV